MNVTFKAHRGTEFEYSTEHDKVTIIIDPWKSSERSVVYDRAEFVRIAKAIEIEALKARHAPALTGVPE